MTENKKLYIGEKRVMMTSDSKKDDKSLIMTLDGGQTVEIKKALFNLIAKEVKGSGNINDSMNAYIAQEFLLKLSEYGLEIFQLEGIATALGTLAHNLAESKIGEYFNCKNSDHIRLEDIIK